MDSFSPEVLLALQALLSKELASRGVASSVKEASVAPPKKAAKVSKEAKEAKEPVAKRAPGAWAAWTKHAPLAHAKEYAEFKASNVGAVGIAPLFCTQWRSAHAEEYAAFELAHKASASAPSPAEPSPASAPAAAEPSPAKEGRKWSEEAKAKAALKRAATKTAKALAEAPAAAAAKEVVVSAAAPAPLPSAPPSAPSNASAPNPFDDEEEEAEAELLPFKLGGRNYQRPGVSRLGAEPIWATGDLWEAKADGTRGDWAGVLEEDGSIDLDADEPSIF
jgi:hypothetical protein